MAEFSILLRTTSFPTFTDQFQFSEHQFDNHLPETVQNSFLLISYTHSRHPLLQVASILNQKSNIISLIIPSHIPSTLHKLNYAAPLAGLVRNLRKFSNLSTRYKGQTRMTNSQTTTNKSWLVRCSRHNPGFS